MMRVQEFLRAGGTIEGLREKFGIKSNRHKVHANLVSLKYHQIDSPMHEPIVRECRGVILDESDNWAVVARPFDKFFNHDEPGAAAIDWGSAVVQEKLDGSLITLYPYVGTWWVATSGTPDALGPVNGADKTFADLFWETFREQAMKLPFGARGCFMFELTSPVNRVVVRHQAAKLTLIGIRDVTGREYPVAAGRLFGFEPVREYALHSQADIATALIGVNPLEQEGYVVVDKHFNRVKVKHPGYVALHHAADGFGPKRILEIVRSGEVSEVEAALPEYAPQFADTRARIDAFVSELELTYERLRHIQVQKDFALEATQTRCPSALFMLRAGKVRSIREHLANLPIESAMRLLKLRDERREVAP